MIDSGWSSNLRSGDGVETLVPGRSGQVALAPFFSAIEWKIRLFIRELEWPRRRKMEEAGPQV